MSPTPDKRLSIFIRVSSDSLVRGSGWDQADTVTVFHTAKVISLTVACLHALCVAILLRVPCNGSHIGHVVTLGVGVGRVRRVARHIRGGRVILWRETERERVKYADGERTGRKQADKQANGQG